MISHQIPNTHPQTMEKPERMKGKARPVSQGPAPSGAAPEFAFCAATPPSLAKPTFSPARLHGVLVIVESPPHPSSCKQKHRGQRSSTLLSLPTFHKLLSAVHHGSWPINQSFLFLSLGHGEPPVSSGAPGESLPQNQSVRVATTQVGGSYTQPHTWETEAERLP